MAEDNSAAQPAQQIQTTQQATQATAQVATVVPERTFTPSMIMEVRNASQETTTKLTVQQSDTKQQ